MNYGITLTFDLDDADEAVRKYCEENQCDVPDYSTLIDRIQEDLEKLDGVEEVMFKHMSWMKVNFGDLDFDEVKTDAEIVKEEIKTVFAKHGVAI